MAQQLRFGEFLHLPPLYAILNLDSSSDSAVDPCKYALRLLEAGVRIVQLRAKGVADLELLDVARKLRELTSAHQATLVINDRVDICLLCGADGVHLGQDDIPAFAAREMLGQEAIIGFSTHNEVQLRCAPIEALSYLAHGPIFETITKPGANPVVGLSILRENASALQLPLVAIGGINTENCAEVYAAGASSVAVVSDLENSSNLSETLQSYQNSYDLSVR